MVRELSHEPNMLRIGLEGEVLIAPFPIDQSRKCAINSLGAVRVRV